MSTFPLRILLCASLLLLTATLDINYYKSANAAFTRSSFQVAYSQNGAVVDAIITQPNSNNPFTAALWRPGQSAPNSEPYQIISQSGNVMVTFNPLDQAGEWRLEILPTDPATHFRFNVVIRVDNRTVGSFSDVARYQRIFTLYHRTAGSYSVSLNLPNGDTGTILSLFGPFSGISVNGGEQLQGDMSPNQVIEYRTSGKEYYYVQVEVSAELMQIGQFINLKYKTDQFECPYDSSYSDYNGVFQGCSTVVPTQGFPCINFDNARGTCLACSYGYVVSDQGICFSNTNCGEKQWMQFGKCYDVIANCREFEFYGGRCNICENGFQLGVDQSGNQICNQVIPVCLPNQYLLGTKCVNSVDNCANFESSTGNCLICKQGYILSNNYCYLQPQQPAVSCPLGQYLQGSYCVVMDEYCIFYKEDNTCMLCAKGYRLEGNRCNKIICSDRQFSQYGYCVDVSPLCGKFDPIYGNCLTCANGIYYLQTDGTCLQGLASVLAANQKKSKNSCPENYYNRQGTCVAVNPLCATFNEETGACTSCTNSDYFLNSQGGCIKTSEYCGTRTYFSNGDCLPVSSLCDLYDAVTGYCLSCRDNSVLTNDGRCLYNETCKERQYKSSNGACVDVSDKCGEFDKENGSCLTCVNNYELNEGGFCCYKFNYMVDKKCVKFYNSNCVSQRPNFNNCLKCKDGFDLTNGVFGRCNPK